MKIKDVKTYVVGNPPPHFGGAYFVFVKLTTNDGIEGFGEAYSVPFQPQLVALMIEDVCDRYVIGANPFNIERLWRVIYSSGYTQRPDTSLLGVLSAVEMACWDIIGKAVNKPVYDLLGGQVHERLRSYTYLYPKETDKTDVYLDPDLAAERAVEYVKQGFTAVKFDPVGAYSAFDPRQLSLRVGGILEAKKIAGMAEAFYAQIAPHLYCGPIVGAANIQIATCSPNFLIQESIQTWGAFHAELLKVPIRWEDGYIIPPTGPGLGAELNEEVAAMHPYSGGKGLHLEMLDRPV